MYQFNYFIVLSVLLKDFNIFNYKTKEKLRPAVMQINRNTTASPNIKRNKRSRKSRSRKSKLPNSPPSPSSPIIHLDKVGRIKDNEINVYHLPEEEEFVNEEEETNKDAKSNKSSFTGNRRFFGENGENEDNEETDNDNEYFGDSPNRVFLRRSFHTPPKKSFSLSSDEKNDV